MVDWIADSGLQSRVESLMRKSNSEFSVCCNMHSSRISECILVFLRKSSLDSWVHMLNISTSSSGGYIADEWTRLCIPISRLYRWKDKDKAVSRMDHKGERIIFDIHAGILRLFLHSISQKHFFDIQLNTNFYMVLWYINYSALWS